MPLNLQHKNWESTGRKFEVLDAQDRPTGKFCWAGIVGEQQIQDDQGVWHPYIYDTQADELRYAHADLRCQFQAGQQVIKHANNVLVESLKFFIQREISSVWVDQPHGLPTRSVLHNKRFLDKQVVDDEGYCIGWLEFPDAQYDLQLGIQAGRRKRATMGFRFRAPASGNVRMQIIKDGIEPGQFDLTQVEGPQGARTVGVRFKKFELRWTYKEALYHTISQEDSSKYPGKKKGIITVGPFDYTANDWLEVSPLTWGLTETSDDCYESWRTNYYDYTYDPDGDSLVLGSNKYAQSEYDGGFTWPNVTAYGTAEDGCYIRFRSNDNDNPGCFSYLYTVDNADTVQPRLITAWSASYRPRTHTARHSSKVAFNSNVKDQYVNTGEIKTIIQDRFDDDHESGDSIAIVLLGIPQANNAFIEVAAESNATYSGPQLYIVYSAGGATKSLIHILFQSRLLPLIPIFGFINRCIANLPLSRRRFLNILNWFRGQK